MDYTDYYKILGIDKKATQDEIKKAYRTLAVKHHPDKNPDNKAAEEQFKKINEANTVLSNPEKRKKYDEFGENWQQNEQAASQGGGNPFGGAGGQQYYTGNEGFGGQSDFSDIFEQFFAGKHEEQAKPKAEKVAIMKPKWKSVWKKLITERAESLMLITKSYESQPSKVLIQTNCYA